MKIAIANSRTVFPTPVGVFLKDAVYFGIGIGLPHARGGVSSTVMP